MKLKTKTKYSLYFLVFFNLTVFGQISGNFKLDKITIYEYGSPLKSCESNFINLFANWSKWIINHNDTEFLSYEYIETIEDEKSKEYYSKKLNNINSLGRKLTDIVEEKINEIDTIYTRKLCIRLYPLNSIPEEMKNIAQVNKKKYFAELEEYLEIMNERFKNIVTLGDKVYKIKLKICQKEYDHYVICRPQENKIVYDNLFLAISEYRYRLNLLFPN
ncbi:hypothetical protein ACFQ1R_01235 [Mariniflexile jejuense]|uniref:Uncharacterized protein n=1 Tax=Mariniflexile jejuense TaxID=1173582 RepID=A0ABW3JF24_9FLAO